jgi:hypothetical protein
MIRRPCLDCGRLTAGSRCSTHERQHRAKYGSAHRALRRVWAPVVAAGGVRCSRCGDVIAVGDGWDLDHRLDGSRPSHARCNRSAGGQP